MRRNNIDFPYAIRSFVGYLEGTKKSFLTIKNYRLDISSFQSFLEQEYLNQTFSLENISRSDVVRYRNYLKEKGLKTNTRRRKLLTVTQFLNYLAKRKKLAPEMTQKMTAPHKIERIPFTVCSAQLILAISKLPIQTLLDLRNKVLLWTLAETGCLVSELSELRYDQWVLASPDLAIVQITGKSSRAVPVSIELFKLLQRLKHYSDPKIPWIFSGFNKFGSMGSPITSRGVEMIVKHYSLILKFTDLTPRTFRHSVILKWFQDDVPQSEIQARLGLKTTYAFRSYETLLQKAKSKN